MYDLRDSAKLLRDARVAGGLSQRALAERADTSQSVVARIESGTSVPGVDTLRRLVQATGHHVEVRLRVSGEGLKERARRWFASSAPRGVVAAYLHGSEARGEGHRESDVDIGLLLDVAVHPGRAARSALRVEVASELVTALGRDEVDVVILNDVPPGFGARVVLEGWPIGIGDAEQAHAFARDVQLRVADLRPFLRRARRLKLEAIGR
jgi:transcriptional regulator with XRE-family HTH domain